MRLFESEHRLEEKLRKCSYITLSEEKRVRMKNQIMGSLPSLTEAHFGFEALIEKIKKFALEISPSLYFRTLLKEKLVTLAEFQFSREFTLRPKFRRKIFAGVLAFVFLFSVVFNYTFKIERVEASFTTVLEQLSGEVSVIRGDSVLPGTTGFVLKADDIIRTGSNSKAAIRFLDQSMSRLDENTEIKIEKLFINPANKTETIVEVILHRGRLWARVINLVNKFSKFQVRADNTVAVAKKKAAFDVSISSQGKTKVAAVKNKVDLVVATEKKVMETTLMKGFSASSSATKIIPKKTGEEDEWILENLEEDEEYIATVKQENRDQIQNQVKVMPGSPFYAMKELTEGTKIALTLDDFDRQKKILITVSEKLAEAQAVLENGDRAKAAVLLLEFQQAVTGVIERIKPFEASHPAETSQLKAFINEILNGAEKQLALILPTDPMYPLKEAISATKLLVAETSIAKTEERLVQATTKLLEAHDFAEQGDTVNAAQQVEAYREAISGVISDVKQMSNDEKEKAVTALIDNKVDDLKVLEAMVSTGGTSSTSSLPPQPVAEAPGTSSVVLPPSPPLESTEPLVAPEMEILPTEKVTPAVPMASTSPELQQTVQDAKTETLAQLGEAVLDVQKDNLSVQVLQKLEDIKGIDVNGKQLVNVQVSRNSVQIRTDSSIISVIGTSSGVIGTTTFTFPKGDLGIPKSPQVQP